jgi:proteic killer suppression protein
VITGFHDRATEDIFNGEDTAVARRIPRQLWPVAVRKLDMLEAAHDLRDLRIPPGNRLESLKGKWAGRYSIRVNDQFRVVFGFDGGNATDVWITDYHSGGGT